MGRLKKDEQNNHSFRLDEKKNILFEQSGAHINPQFITNYIFQFPLQVVVTDKSAMDVCIKLSEINTEIRKVGVNYNQVIKAENIKLFREDSKPYFRFNTASEKGD